MALVVVAGALANKSGSGGEAWVRLSYLLGFRQLGWDVWFVEQIRRDSYLREAGDYFDSVAAAFGFGATAMLVDEDGQWLQGPVVELGEIAREADLLVNISGNLQSPLLARFRRKAFVDIDPGFTQFWHASGEPSARLGGHEVFFTIAENIGRPDCLLPTCGIEWRPTRPPVVLSEWPTVDGGARRFTTVASWRSPFGPIPPYGLKHHEWRKVLPLPELTEQQFEAALAIHPWDAADREALERHRWRLVDPIEAAGDPNRFRRYVQASGAEFSVAQGIYVDTWSGWFSDRSVRYLASGKPVLVQDTGFAATLPVGEGLLSFRTLDEAVAGVGCIAAKYEAHSRAARAIAEEHFESDRLLTRLLEDAL